MRVELFDPDDPEFSPEQQVRMDRHDRERDEARLKRINESRADALESEGGKG